MSKLRLAWKYRKLIWKYRSLYKYRKLWTRREDVLAAAVMAASMGWALSHRK